MLKIIADSAIPFLEGVLDSWAEVRRLPGAVITAADVRDADALIIRTRTRCNAALLDGSRVGFIATATIGFDHIDLEYCRRRGIGVATAAGCNARGVLQWAGAVLHYLSREQGWSPAERTLGVVGVGHVGRAVVEAIRPLGVRLLLNDPPQEEQLRRAGKPCGEFTDLRTLQEECDIISFHTPLVTKGDYAVMALAGADVSYDDVDKAIDEALK